MTVTKAQFVWAIRQQESGGNYSAGNPSGAMGAYQILASNLPDWTREALGHVVGPTEFLKSKTIQDEVADYKLGKYFDRYGPEKAASAWYSGDPNLYASTAPQPGGPSIATYVAEVMAHARQAPANVTLPLSNSTGGAPGSGGSVASGTDASVLGDVLGFPADVVKFFSKATDDLAEVGNFFYAFTLPSTWVRIGAGGLGLVLLMAGIVCLGLSAAKGSAPA